MPLGQFIEKTMALLGTDSDEIVVNGASAFCDNAGRSQYASVEGFDRQILAVFSQR